MTRSHLTLTLFTLVFSAQLSAQKKFFPGSILMTNKEVKTGLIYFQITDRSPEEVRFKSGKEAPEQVFKPGEILGYQVADVKYFSAETKTETSPSTAPYLDDHDRFAFREDTLFLQVMTEGEKSLYYHKNELGKENFYLKIGDKYVIIPYKKYTNESGEEKERDDFLETLKDYLGECSLGISKIRYNKKSLTDLFQAYYACKAQAPEFVGVGASNNYRFGPVIGVSSTSLNFKGSVSSFSYLIEGDYSGSINPAAGFAFEAIWPRLRRKLSLYNELFYTVSSFTDIQTERRLSENDYDIYTAALEISNLNILSMVRYHPLADGRGIYVNAGASLGFNLKRNNTTIIDSYFFGSESQTEVETIIAFRTFEIGIAGGVGYKIGKFGVELRFVQTNGLTNFAFLTGTRSQVSFLASYTLN